jgi:hypothetical protein
VTRELVDVMDSVLKPCVCAVNFEDIFDCFTKTWNIEVSVSDLREVNLILGEHIQKNPINT